MADEINVKVTADVTEVSQGMEKASASLGQFSESVNAAAAAAQRINPAAFKDLAQELNRGDITAREFAASLKSITPAAEEAAASTAVVSEASHLTAGSMRELVVVGRELASGNFTRLPGSLSILATRLGGIPPQAILATAAIAAFGYAIYEIIDGSEKLEADLAKIQNAFSAVGRGDLFNRTEALQYIDTLRQIPGVSEDAATSIVNEFARARNGGQLMSEVVSDIKPLAELLGVEVPEASKILASALNDPVKGLQDLRKYGVELTAAQQEQIIEMMAVNDAAGAQRVLLDGLATALSHVVDASTGLQRFFSNIKNDFRGINEQASGTRVAVDLLADSLLHVQGISERNLPANQWSGSSGSVQATDQATETKKNNEEVAVTNRMFEAGNSALREQEQHKQNILKIQVGINAAEALGDDAAVKRAYADLETENKRYYDKTQSKPDHSADKDAEAEARAAAEGADAEIKEQRDLVEEKRRLGQISVADSVKQLDGLAAQEHAINLKRIADMRAVYEKQGDKAGLASTQGESQKEDARYKGDVNKIDAEGRQETRAAQQAEMEGDRRVSEEKIRTAQVAMEQKVALGQLSAQQEIGAEIEAASQKHAIDDKYYDELLSHYAKDSEAYQKTLAEKQVAEQKFNQQVLQLRTKLALDSQKVDNQLTQAVTRGLNQTVSGVLQGTQTMGQAFQRMGSNIVLSVVDGALDKVVQKVLSNNSTIEAAQTALNAFLEFIGLASADDQEQTTSKSANAQIDAYAAEGAASAAAAAAGGGPGAAAAAGAATFAIIEGFQIAEVASAAGGWVVPNDQLAMVHENEMILPAHLSQGISGMIAGGSAGSGSGHTFNNTFHVNAGDGISAQQLPDMIVKTMSKAMRNGQFGGMRGG